MNRKRNKLTPLGLKVKKALLERGWTQKEFCAREKIKQSRFSEILYGTRPGDKYRSRIIQALGLEESA